MLLIAVAGSAHATSCLPTDQRFVFSCSAQACTGAFRVDEVRSFSTCGRRPVVNAIDPQVARFLAPALGAPAPGVYTITLRASYGAEADNDGSLAAVSRWFEAQGVHDVAHASGDRPAPRPDELRAVIERTFGAQGLSRDTVHGDAAAARRDWEDRAWKARAVDVAQQALYLSSALTTRVAP